MSSHAPGAIQVEKVLDDLIHRLVNSENGPEVRAALIEARRLRNVAMRWAAIPPQPDARREMLARVMELIDSVNQTTERNSGERAVLVSPGAFTSVPPPAGNARALSPVPPKSAPVVSKPPPAAPVLVAAEAHPSFSREEPTVDEKPVSRPPEPAADEIPDLGVPPVPSFGAPPAPKFGPPPSSPGASPSPARRPLTLRPPGGPTEPFERSVSSVPTSAKPVPIKAVPSARGEALEGLSTTISSSQRKAVRESDAASTAASPSASPKPSTKPTAPRPSSVSSQRKPPPLPKRPPSTAATPAVRPPVTETQRPPPGQEVTTTLASGLVLVRPAAAEWQPHPMWAGTSMKLLYHNPENGGEYTALVRLDAGAVLPHRRHVKPEEMWMVSGAAKVGDLEMRAGEYTRAEAGSHHPRITSAQGCVFLLRGFDDDEILDSNPPTAGMLPDPSGLELEDA